LVLLDVIHLTEAINLAIDESSHHIDEAFDSAQRVICVRVNHAGLLVKVRKDFIVPIALLEVLISPLVASTDQVDAAVFGGDGPGVEGHFELHGNWSLLELLVVNLENVRILLIPLERVNSTGYARMEAVLDVIVNS
jgi:hypothetical protein